MMLVNSLVGTADFSVSFAGDPLLSPVTKSGFTLIAYKNGAASDPITTQVDVFGPPEYLPRRCPTSWWSGCSAMW